MYSQQSLTVTHMEDYTQGYLINLQHFSDISRTLISSVSKQLFVPKTKLNIGKHAFSVAESIPYCN